MQIINQRMFMCGKLVFLLTMFFLLVLGYANAQSSSRKDRQQEPQPRQVQKQQVQMTLEEQVAKYEKHMAADANSWRSFSEWGAEQQKVKGKDWKASVADMNKFLPVKDVTGKDAFTFLQSAELAKPFWFKIRALYKGYNKEEKDLYLEDLPENNQTTTLEATLTNIFGISTYTFTIYDADEEVSTKNFAPNTIVTFYCYGDRFFTEGNYVSLLRLFIISDDGIVVLFDSSKFSLANNLKYISASIENKSNVENDLNIMKSMALTGTVPSAFFSRVQGNQSPNSTPENVFDPIRYQKGELLDARSAMNKKDIRNENTLPEVRIKFVSEVIFKGQSNTTVTVSTSDNAFTERMEFLGRSSTIKTGDKIRIYYTIAKDPLEKWEVHALERL
jgi:hypothetical protein